MRIGVVTEDSFDTFAVTCDDRIRKYVKRIAFQRRNVYVLVEEDSNKNTNTKWRVL